MPTACSRDGSEVEPIGLVLQSQCESANVPDKFHATGRIHDKSHIHRVRATRISLEVVIHKLLHYLGHAAAARQAVVYPLCHFFERSTA
jgi:hypothetical protein